MCSCSTVLPPPPPAVNYYYYYNRIPLFHRLRPPSFPFSKPPPSSSSTTSSIHLHRLRLHLHHRHRHRHQVCLSSSSINSNNNNNNNNNNKDDFGNEESRWMREEQRWLREEQRWLRQESRWQSERQSLLRQLADLRLQIQQLHRLHTHSQTLSRIASLLQVFTDNHLIPQSAQAAPTTPIQPALSSIVGNNHSNKQKQEEEEEEDEAPKMTKVPQIRNTLRMGSQGEDVRALQDGLLQLGFYSGEEDMEYSSFSSGTERAVKTWQASIGVREDGIMTVDLLERLYYAEGSSNSASSLDAEQIVTDKDEANGAAAAAASSVTKITEVQQTVVNEGNEQTEIPQQRVFLLGENRWEEPSRLIGKGNQAPRVQTRDSVTKCQTCRGEGRLLCMECDGTGEPNVEPQFLEWVEEGAKCPYCDGLGFNICDVCNGKAAALP